MGRDGHDRARRYLLAADRRAGTSLQKDAAGADALAMRSLLEFLGIVEPEGVRREPVALPAWSRRLLPIVIGALAICSTLVLALVRALGS